MTAFGSGKHHGSLSRQIYWKKLKAVRNGEIPSIIEYGTLEDARRAIEGVP
jgi:hypothetical protein